MIIIIKKYHILIFSLCIMLVCLFTSHFKNESIATMAIPTSDKVICIDAGHGGNDPGKVGQSGVLEKDINLNIAKLLQGYLENTGAKIYMTRIEDEGLYNKSSKNKKREDLRNRKLLINESGANIIVSIHQNSFTQSKYKGAQVFYHEASDEGKKLAEIIQNEMKDFLAKDNKRKAKPNDSYYILKQTTIPAVIIECGFLSNHEEENLLKSEDYQKKVAFAIYKGIIKYFEG